MTLKAPFFDFNYKDGDLKYFEQSQNDIAQPKIDVGSTIEDLNRCGDLYFVLPDNTVIECPETEGAGRLVWLENQITTHITDETKRNKYIDYIRKYAHQNGFLFAGRNGINQKLIAKSLIQDANKENNDHKLASTFGITKDGNLTYFEMYQLPRAFQKIFDTGEMQSFESKTPIATVETYSTLAIDEQNEISHRLNNIHVKVHDPLAAEIFDELKDNIFLTQSMTLMDISSLASSSEPSSSGPSSSGSSSSGSSSSEASSSEPNSAEAKIFDYEKEKQFLNTILMMDVINAAQEKKLNLLTPHLTEVYMQKINEMIKKHNVDFPTSKLLELAQREIESALSIGLRKYPSQHAVKNYDRWRQGTEGGSYKPGYYIAHYLQSTREYFTSSSTKPKLLMDDFTQHYEEFKKIETQSKDTAKPFFDFKSKPKL